MKEKIKKIFGFVKDHIWWFVAFAIFALIALNAHTCSRLSSEKEENQRLNNNILAMNDTLKNYKSGKYQIAEMRALQLKINELADSLKLERNKKPVTIIKYIAKVSDTIVVPVKIIHDTLYINDDVNISDAGIIYSYEHSVFGNSSRTISIETPYYVDCDDGKVYADGESIVNLEQNIWFDNVLYKDKKGYTYARLKTDYPGINFNSGTAILVSDPKTEKASRKNFGLGLGIQVGYGVAFPNGTVKMSPYVGLGIGLQWNPKFLQF